ncbi:uncharacterized protein C2845_PM17G05730 [Panicum miliaceum]|uniref:C2H2-type domain-containing protein n=1 Tax=Panicum miliaceum TaxID=4540 RepID=A0A3L6Q1D5_PANMI|nr:uncharacterized protein C2845_PM17G05730 [Panicum miliaceum]
MGASRKSSHVTTKDSAETARDIISTSSQIQSMKVPDAVAAIAQAAAKANGETEKYLPGWPLFSPPKVQLDKCTKCSREFCSSINFRRHTRVHRRTLKVDKDFPKNRDLLAAFWNKLTVDEASTVLSLSNVVVEGVTGSSILTTLSSWMCKPGYASLPMAYARAGSELLDLIQTKVSMQLPVSSNELFSVLDEASEKTFLCTNTAACIQKFLFDGEANKIATELKNVVACASYMLEQKLVEAWCADKTAEALRCQKLLVEEEEAAQKRQAELMERKRMKKLRQKEQRLKDLKDENVAIQLPEIMDDTTCSPGIQSFKAISDPDLYEQEKSHPAPVTSETGNAFNVDLSVEDVSCDSAPEMDKGVVLRKQVISRHHLGRTEKLAENSFVSGSTVASKQAALARPSNYRDAKVCSSPNRNKTWARKVPAEIGNQCPKHGLDVDDEHNMAPSKNSRVLIGSISVAIEDGSEHLKGSRSKNDPAPPSSKIVKHASANVVRLVTHEENRNEGISNSDGNSAPAVENRSCFSSMTDESSHSTCRSVDFAEGEHLRRTMFSSKEATSFLSQSKHLTAVVFTHPSWLTNKFSPTFLNQVVFQHVNLT